MNVREKVCRTNKHQTDISSPRLKRYIFVAVRIKTEPRLKCTFNLPADLSYQRRFETQNTSFRSIGGNRYVERRNATVIVGS